MEAVTARDPLPATRKAAVLLIMLGQQDGANLVRHLSPEEVAVLGRTIASVGSINSSQAEDVLQEYVRMTQARQYVVRGGPDYARRMLTGALGEESATRLIDRISESDGHDGNQLSRIETAEPRQLAGLLEGEHPQATAIVLSRLAPQRAAAVLQALPQSVRPDVTLRLASLDRVPPDVISKIAEVVGRKLQTGTELAGVKAGGVRAVAEVLNHMDSADAEDLLETVAGTDANTAELVRHHMFVFEDILTLGEEAIKQIVAKTDRPVLTIALKGTSEKLRNSVMQCLSQRGADMLKEDMEAAGPVRIRDVEQAQRQVIALVRQMQQEGVIGKAGEQYVA